MITKIDITNIRLETERLILRPFKETDLNNFFEYASVEGVGEMAGWPHHTDIKITKKILGFFIDGKKTFAIVDKKSNKVIGSLGIEEGAENIPENESGREIGYVLSKEYWGRGLMPEAVKEVIKYIFNNTDAKILSCCHFDYNNQSKRVIEKCGFIYSHESEFFAQQLNKNIKDKVYFITKENYLKNNLI